MELPSLPILLFTFHVDDTERRITLPPGLAFPSSFVCRATEGSVWCDAVKFKEEYRPTAFLYILLV